MKILRAATAIVLALCAVFTVFIGKNKITENGVSVLPAEYKGILTLWNIDSFEGGVGSRKQFLLSAGRGFEKENSGVLLMVVDHTPESAESAMAEGRFPDMISYGAGVAVCNLQPIKTDKIWRAGTYNGATYAVPWCRGGYCLIENPYFVKGKNTSENLIVSQGEFTNPLVAYAVSGRKIADTEIFSPMNAYVRFTSGKARQLLGTQRDINRLISRGMDFTSKPVEGYNDLYQYISVTAESPVKAEYAQSFVNYLLSDEIQSRLFSIGMCSCFMNVDYDSPDMAALQSAKYEYTVSAFSSSEFISNLQKTGKAASMGNEGELVNLKKLLTLS